MNINLQLIENPVIPYYKIGLTFITISFIYLLYLQIYYKSSIKLPKVFLLLYGIGCIFLVVKNIIERNIYIATCELIGCLITLILFFLNKN